MYVLNVTSHFTPKESCANISNYHRQGQQNLAVGLGKVAEFFVSRWVANLSCPHTGFDSLCKFGQILAHCPGTLSLKVYIDVHMDTMVIILWDPQCLEQFSWPRRIVSSFGKL